MESSALPPLDVNVSVSFPASLPTVTLQASALLPSCEFKLSAGNRNQTIGGRERNSCSSIWRWFGECHLQFNRLIESRRELTTFQAEVSVLFEGRAY